MKLFLKSCLPEHVRHAFKLILSTGTFPTNTIADHHVMFLLKNIIASTFPLEIKQPGRVAIQWLA